MNITIDIDVQDKRWLNVIDGLVDGYLRKIVTHTLQYIPHIKERAFEEIEISYVFADDATIAELNKGYRGKDRATNVLSFPQVDWDEPSIQIPVVNIGDEVLAFETIEREAQEQDKSIHDHTTHMIIHGLLHLCGYDHIEENEAEIMEALEVDILAGLSIKNPYQN